MRSQHKTRTSRRQRPWGRPHHHGRAPTSHQSPSLPPTTPTTSTGTWAQVHTGVHRPHLTWAPPRLHGRQHVSLQASSQARKQTRWIWSTILMLMRSIRSLLPLTLMATTMIPTVARLRLQTAPSNQVCLIALCVCVCVCGSVWAAFVLEGVLGVCVCVCVEACELLSTRCAQGRLRCVCLEACGLPRT